MVQSTKRGKLIEMILMSLALAAIICTTAGGVYSVMPAEDKSTTVQGAR